MLYLPDSWVRFLGKYTVIPFLFTCIFLVIGFWNKYESYQALLNGGITQATVIGFEIKHSRDLDHDFHYVDYQYTIGTKTFTTKRELVSDDMYQIFLITPTTQIHYSIENPSISKLVNNLDYEEDLLIGTKRSLVAFGFLLGGFWGPFERRPYLSFKRRLAYQMRFMIAYSILVWALFHYRFSQQYPMTWPATSTLVALGLIFGLAVIPWSDLGYVLQSRIDDTRMTYWLPNLLFPGYLAVVFGIGIFYVDAASELFMILYGFTTGLPAMALSYYAGFHHVLKLEGTDAFSRG